jgi:hypothetical protein
MRCIKAEKNIDYPSQNMCCLAVKKLLRDNNNNNNNNNIFINIQRHTCIVNKKKEQQGVPT